jgi:hypothetical protein
MTVVRDRFQACGGAEGGGRGGGESTTRKLSLESPGFVGTSWRFIGIVRELRTALVPETHLPDQGTRRRRRGGLEVVDGGLNTSKIAWSRHRANIM